MRECRIAVDQLREGDRVRLELKWVDHPFLSNSFKIKNQKQIGMLKALGLESVLCQFDGQRPHAEPRPLDPPAASPAPEGPPATAGEDPVAEEIRERKKQQIERLKHKHESLKRCEKRFDRTAQNFRNLMDNFLRSPVEATEKADHLVGDIIEELLFQDPVLYQLMNTRAEYEDVYYHSLNVTILSLTLGKEMGLDKDTLRKLGVGCLFHDFGKYRIPKALLAKTSPLTEPERKLIRLHPLYGEQETVAVSGFPAEAVQVIRQHHELARGNGYPDGLKGDQISPCARVVAVANAYDNHCNGLTPSGSLTPYQALALMFHKQKEDFGAPLLAMFVRSLGVYPPGTMVQLTNGATGIVVAMNPSSSLRPSVLVYDPEVPREQALIVDIENDPELKIEQALQPNTLPTEVCEYLAPRKRVVYFLDTPEPKPTPRN